MVVAIYHAATTSGRPDLRLFRKRSCDVDGHHFEPRYDERPNGYIVHDVIGMTAEQIRRLMLTQTYVRDVCRYCGKTIER